MDMGHLHRITLIKDSAVPLEGRLRLRDAKRSALVRLRDARRNALVRQNVAVARLVGNIRSLTSFSFKLFSKIYE